MRPALDQFAQAISLLQRKRREAAIQANGHLESSIAAKTPQQSEHYWNEYRQEHARYMLLVELLKEITDLDR